jgi:hypothetical protein
MRNLVQVQGAEVVKKQTGTAFTGAAGLQKNIDFPVKLQDKVCCACAPKPLLCAGNTGAVDTVGAPRALVLHAPLHDSQLKRVAILLLRRPRPATRHRSAPTRASPTAWTGRVPTPWAASSARYVHSSCSCKGALRQVLSAYLRVVNRASQGISWLGIHCHFVFVCHFLCALLTQTDHAAGR